MGLQSIVRSITGFVLHIALHKYKLEFDNSGPAGILNWISGTKSGYATIVLSSVDSSLNVGLEQRCGFDEKPVTLESPHT